VMIIRIGSSMYFANVAFIRDYISKMISEFSEAADTSGANPVKGAVSTTGAPPRAAEPIQYIVIEMTPVTSIDSTAVHMLEDMFRDLKERGIRLAFSTIGNRVEDTLERSGLIEKMGPQWVHPSVHSAVQHCIRHRMRSTGGGKVETQATDRSPTTEATPGLTDSTVQAMGGTLTGAVHIEVVKSK